MSNIKHLLEQRKALRKKRPAFIRDGYGKRKRIDSKWRVPRGRHSKLRHQFAGHRKKVMPGFRTPELVRGLDNAGLQPVVVSSLGDVMRMSKDRHSAILSSGLGKRKRLILIAELKKHTIAVNNVTEKYVETILEEMKQRKALREEHMGKKTKKAEKKEAKKEKELNEEEKMEQEKKEKEKILTKAK